MWEYKHGVTSNTLNDKQRNLDGLDIYPTVFSRLRNTYANAKSSAYFSWPGFQQLCGLCVDHCYGPSCNGGSPSDTSLADSRTCFEALKELQASDCADVILSQFLNVDSTGQKNGFCLHAAEYIQAIEEVDALVGHLLAAIRVRKLLFQENWLE